MEGIHILFKPWKDRIFSNDPTLRKEIQKNLKELEEQYESKREDEYK